MSGAGAVLLWGFPVLQIGDDWPAPRLCRFEGGEPPLGDPDDDLELRLVERGHLPDPQPPHTATTSELAEYRRARADLRRAATADCRLVEVGYHDAATGHAVQEWYACPTAAMHVVDLGHSVDVLEFADLSIDYRWEAQLRTFCDRVGLSWDRPRWVLTGYRWHG